MRFRHAPTATCLLLGAALAAAPAAGAAPPRATVVACGTQLTTSVRLAADVVCPTGGGIALAADGIELNLNGHRLVGPGTGSGTGVFVDARDVTVRNGTVVGWGTGVAHREDERVEDFVHPGPPSVTGTVRQVRIEGSDVGVDTRPGGLVVVRDSVLRGNDRGAVSTFGGRVRIEGSTVEGNRTGAFSFSTVSDGLVVRDSLVRGNRYAGISCSQDGAYDVSGSTLQRNGYGLEVFECNGRVEGSRFVWNRQHVGGYLAPRDRIDLVCNSYTRDGGPVPFPVQPCPAGAVAPALPGAG
jgi:Right handed beta helix region